MCNGRVVETDGGAKTDEPELVNYPLTTERERIRDEIVVSAIPEC